MSESMEVDIELGALAPTRDTQAVEHVFAMRRSGHHAIMNWLQACYEETGQTVLFANSVYDGHLSYDGQRPDRTPESLWDEAASFDVMIANYQEVAYGDRASIPTYDLLQPGFTGLTTRDTVVVRDFYSMAASRLHYMNKRRAEGGSDPKMEAMDWSTVGKCWIDLATMVAQAEDEDPSFIGIAFNQWFTDPEYRKEIAVRYGLPDSDKSLEDVPELSGGSSFDGLSQQGNARAMNVLRRWGDLSSRLLPEYRAAIAVHLDEIDDLNNRLFGFGHSEVAEALG